MVELGVISALAVLSRARSVDIPLVSIKRNKVSLFSPYLLLIIFLCGSNINLPIQDVSRALANLAAKVEIHFDIHHQGGLACLISAAHRTTEEVCQRLLSMAIQFLCMNFNVRNAIIKEKGLGQFISITRQREHIGV